LDRTVRWKGASPSKEAATLLRMPPSLDEFKIK